MNRIFSYGYVMFLYLYDCCQMFKIHMNMTFCGHKKHDLKEEIMIRIGKITLDGHDNYGNKLQNFALQAFLERYAAHVDTLWHSSLNIFDLDMAKWPLARRVRLACLESKFEKRIDHWMHEAIRKYRFKQFDDQHIHTRYDCGNILRSDIAREYDFFLTGSDQVWNPHEQQEDKRVNFLTFAPSEKRIAYAASFGVSEIPEKIKKDFSTWIEGMTAISVREQRGAEIVRELTGREVPVLVDPAMLLSAEEWNKIAKKPIWFTNEKYILLYFLSGIPEVAQCNIERLARERNLKIIDLMDEGKIDWYCSDPAEFLYLISHAELIYTDSFHGAVFSILYHRPFVICDRQEKHTEKRANSRIDTLLDLFQLLDRYGIKANQYMVETPFEMDFTGVEKILERERKRSDHFIRSAMGLPLNEVPDGR